MPTPSTARSISDASRKSPRRKRAEEHDPALAEDLDDSTHGLGQFRGGLRYRALVGVVRRGEAANQVLTQLLGSHRVIVARGALRCGKCSPTQPRGAGFQFGELT